MLVIRLWWILEKTCMSHCCLYSLPLVFLFIIFPCMWVHFQKLCVCKTVNSHLKGICLILKHPLKSLEGTCATHTDDDFHWNCLLLKYTFHHYSLSWLLGFNLRAVLDSKVFWGDGYSYNIVKGDKELDLWIFSTFWLNSIKQHFNGKVLIWRSRETGLTKGPLVKTLRLMEQDITSSDKGNTTFQVSPSPKQFVRVALLEQFWHFKNFF